MDFSSFLGSKLEDQRKYREQPQGWDVGRFSGALQTTTLCPISSIQLARGLLCSCGEVHSQPLTTIAAGQLFPPTPTPATLITINGVYASRYSFNVVDASVLRPLERDRCQLQEPGEHSIQCQEVLISILSSSCASHVLFHIVSCENEKVQSPYSLRSWTHHTWRKLST